MNALFFLPLYIMYARVRESVCSSRYDPASKNSIKILIIPHFAVTLQIETFTNRIYENII